MDEILRISSRRKSELMHSGSQRLTANIWLKFRVLFTLLFFLCVNTEIQFAEGTTTQGSGGSQTIVVFPGLRGSSSQTDPSPQGQALPDGPHVHVVTEWSQVSTPSSVPSSAVASQVPVITNPPENLTRSIGSDVMMRCLATNPADPSQLLTITWYKDDRIIRQSFSPRLKFLQGKQKLTITDVQWEDRGTYACNATNPDGGSTRSSPGRLNVEKGVTIVKGIMNQTVTRGTVVNASCEVEGYPPPYIFWEINKIPYNDPLTNQPYNKQYFVYMAQRTIRLTCKTSNNASSVGLRRRQSSGVIFVTNPPSYCKGYNGYNCQSYKLGSVFINGSADNPTGTLERNLTSFMEGMERLKIPSRCKVAFKSLLCRSVFPACDRSDPENLKMINVCNEDCFAIRDLVCREHWKRIQNITGPFSQLYPSFPDCALSPFTDAGAHCSRTGYFDAMTSSPSTVKCIHQNGHTYEGQQNVTENGSYCQNWNQELYREMGYSPVVFLELHNSHNYCRNPGGLDARPWCFVRKGTLEKQYCSIPTCDPVQGTTSSPPRTLSMDSRRDFQRTESGGNRHEKPSDVSHVNTFELGGYLFVLFSAALVIVVVVVGAPFAIRKFRSLKRYPPYSFPKGFDFKKIPDNPMFGQNFNRSFNPLLEGLEYPRNDIGFVADIGEGAFGRVFKATAVDPSSADQRMIVAVKMLKSSASSEVKENFSREAVLMSKFNNINVIKLCGVCFVGRPLCLLLEFMEKGDLQEFLQSKNPRNPEYFDKEESETGLPRKLLISFARQVANGMVYLSDKRLVHRDVATRNCLVNAVMQVKISDFGMARYLGEEEDFFIGSKEERLPVRWTAPEALWYYKFTVLSDVWSYGVLMWELFSYAEQPYVGMNLEQVFLETQQGHQLPCPEETPPALYKIMKACWQLDASQRPSFQTLNSQLTELESGLHRVTRLSSSSA